MRLFAEQRSSRFDVFSHPNHLDLFFDAGPTGARAILGSMGPPLAVALLASGMAARRATCEPIRFK